MTTMFVLLLIHVISGFSGASSPDDGDAQINMTCVSKDYEELQCTWCPEQPYSNKTWSLSYKVRTKSGTCKHYKDRCTCNICWDEIGNWCYQWVNYTISVTQTEDGISRIKSFIIDPERVVKPSRVQNLVVQSVTKESITVTWTKHTLHDRALSLTYQVEIKPSAFNCPRDVGKSTSYTFTGLRPYTQYDMLVTAKTANSIYLSDPAVITGITKEDAPAAAPTTYPGSFRITEDAKGFQRKLRFYWKNIVRGKRNGKLVNCTVSLTGVVNGTEQTVKQQNNTDEQTSVICSRETLQMPALTNQSYNVQLKAFTKMGPSPVSTWFIPNDDTAPPYPLNVFGETTENSTIKIQWEKPHPDSTNPLSYTVYQCHNPADDETSCFNITAHQFPVGQTQAIIQGMMDSQTRYTMSTEVNNVSSGMMPGWMCVFSHLHVPSQVRFYQNEPEGPQKLSLVWDSLHHPCDVNITTGLAEHIEINWCQALNCSGTVKNATVPGLAVNYTVTGVKPYTNYTVAMVAIGKAGRGTKTEKILTTGQAAPTDPPSNISWRFSEGESTLLTISWRPPSEPNGEILEYRVNLTREDGTTVSKTTRRTNIDFPDLKHYTVYTGRITAYTSVGHSPWSMTSLRSPMSAPSEVSQVEIEEKRKMDGFSDVDIKWKSPKYPNGPITIYRVSSFWYSDGMVIETTNVTAVNHSTTHRIDCSERHRQRAGFNVTAVNELGMESVTETEVRHICDFSGLSEHKWVKVVGVTSSLVVFIIVLLLCLGCGRSLKARYTLPEIELPDVDLEDIPNYPYSHPILCEYEINAHESSGLPDATVQLDESQDSGMESDKSPSPSTPTSVSDTSADSAAVSAESDDTSGGVLVVYKTMAPETQPEETNQNHEFVTSTKTDVGEHEHGDTVMQASADTSSEGIPYVLTQMQIKTDGTSSSESEGNGTVPYMSLRGASINAKDRGNETAEYISHSQVIAYDAVNVNVPKISSGANNDVSVGEQLTSSDPSVNYRETNGTLVDDPGYMITMVHYGSNEDWNHETSQKETNQEPAKQVNNDVSCPVVPPTSEHIRDADILDHQGVTVPLSVKHSDQTTVDNVKETVTNTERVNNDTDKVGHDSEEVLTDNGESPREIVLGPADHTENPQAPLLQPDFGTSVDYCKTTMCS